MMVASHGIIIVARKTRNTMLRPLKSMNAKAYAARLAVMSWPSMTIVDWMTLFKQIACERRLLQRALEVLQLEAAGP